MMNSNSGTLSLMAMIRITHICYQLECIEVGIDALRLQRSKPDIDVERTDVVKIVSGFFHAKWRRQGIGVKPSSRDGTELDSCTR